MIQVHGRDRQIERQIDWNMDKWQYMGQYQGGQHQINADLTLILHEISVLNLDMALDMYTVTPITAS